MVYVHFVKCSDNCCDGVSFNRTFVSTAVAAAAAVVLSALGDVTAVQNVNVTVDTDEIIEMYAT